MSDLPMNETILVNLHCHTFFSDGEQTPEELAGNLAAAGVRYASLTDHDTLEGLPRFHEALKKFNIAYLPGIELTAQYNGKEVHVLGYGVDVTNAELATTLVSMRQIQTLDVHSIAASLRKAGNHRINDSEEDPVMSAAPQGQLAVEDAIRLIHHAGGLAFWAHPLYFESDAEKLDAFVGDLRFKGLDGIEAIYAPFSRDQQNHLSLLARKFGMLISAGTDFHGLNGLGSLTYGIEMPRDDWNSLRKALFSSPDFLDHPQISQQTGEEKKKLQEQNSGKQHRFRRRSFVVRIFLPTLIAILLFLSVLWGIVLPSFEQTLLERKREMIRELTNSAWSILASYQRDEENGLLTREEAQESAITRIEALRYGVEGKDYFWIQDMEPRMIMHPYRPDLNGEELTSFRDPRGVPIFVEFAHLVQRDGEGYIDYVWQWNDDPLRLEPKESYVKGFEPWGWIIGTGVYIDDVNQEIKRIEANLITTSLLISGAIVLLLFFVLQQSLRIERERQEVVDTLRESTNRYHALVESTTEGTLMILNDRCRYANPIFLTMTGYTLSQLEFLVLSDLLPHTMDNEKIWQLFQGKTTEDVLMGKALEGYLQHRDGRCVECILTINPLGYADQQGYILLAKDITNQPAIPNQKGLELAAKMAQVGIFQARAARRCVFTDINQMGSSLLPHISIAEAAQPSLADFFSDPSEYHQFYQTLIKEGEVRDQYLYIETKDANTQMISLSACVVRGEDQQPVSIVGILEDVTKQHKREAETEAALEKLQTSLLFLHEGLDTLGRDVLICDMNTRIEQLSRMMTSHKATAALVASENETVIGIVTDHDLRARVLAENIDLQTPVHKIMSSPITKISETALIYEALMLMEEKGVRHLAVEDKNGQIVSVIDSKSLIQFQRYGPIVLTREVSRSRSVDEIAHQTSRVPVLAKTLLDSRANPRHITHMISSICDAATQRLIQLAIEELGPPPTKFAYIAMGSQGRQEQTLLSDQDNGILYQRSPGDDPKNVADYFLRLGEWVSQGLLQAGYATCRGKVMANNPRWCRSVQDWQSSLETWVEKSESQEIIDLSIFLDFRFVYGDASLSDTLRCTVNEVLGAKAGIFYHFAQGALMFKPPFRLMGNVYLGAGDSEHSGEINLKDAMMPIVSFARLYALRYQIPQTHTLERLEALAAKNHILNTSRDEITSAYDFLMQLRLQSQLIAIQAGQPQNNNIHPGNLGAMQQELLKQSFSQISAVQKKISYDFLGGL
jgi:PAS domain S-box-containing protein